MDVTHSAPLRGVILDMDGVLVDSEPFIREAAGRMFAEKGYHVNPHDFDAFVGTGEDRFIGGVAEQYGIPLLMPQDKERTYALYLELIRGHLQALPGVHPFIEECRRLHLKLAVASSADAVKVEGNLHEIGRGNQFVDLFDQSRRIYVRLQPGQMYSRAESQPNWDTGYSGNWAQ